MFHNRFLVINLYLITVASDPFKIGNAHHSINLADDVVHNQSLILNGKTTWGNKLFFFTNIKTDGLETYDKVLLK